MYSILNFSIYLIVHTLILYLITDKILIHDTSDTSLLKAFIVTLTVSLFYQFIPAMINIPSGFHAEMFARISRYLITLIPYLFIKIIYRFDWKNFFYLLLGNFVLRYVANLLIIKPLFKLLYG